MTAASLDQVSHQLPSGAYTTLRTYHHTRVLRLDAHFDRLEETAALAGQPLVLDRLAIRAAMREILGGFPTDREIRIRLTIDLEQQPGTLFISTELLKIPSTQDYLHGVKVITTTFQRLNPRAKLTQSIERSEVIRQSLPADVNEALLVDPSGSILEGLSSNFFAVRNGLLFTASEGVLEGITRAQVLSQAALCVINVQFRAVNLAELSELNEAFITSASRGILPVRQVDESLIGDGRPGPLTARLRRMFDLSLDKNCQEI